MAIETTPKIPVKRQHGIEENPYDPPVPPNQEERVKSIVVTTAIPSPVKAARKKKRGKVLHVNENIENEADLGKAKRVGVEVEVDR